MGRRCGDVVAMERIHGYGDEIDRRPKMMMMKKKKTSTGRDSSSKKPTAMNHRSNHRVPSLPPSDLPKNSNKTKKKMRNQRNQKLLLLRGPEEEAISARGKALAMAMARLPGSKSFKKCKGQRKKDGRVTSELLREWPGSSSSSNYSTYSASAEDVDLSLLQKTWIGSKHGYFHDSVQLMLMIPALLNTEDADHAHLDPPTPDTDSQSSYGESCTESASPTHPHSYGDQSIFCTDDWFDLGPDCDDLDSTDNGERRSDNDADIELFLLESTHITAASAEDDAEWLLC